MHGGNSRRRVAEMGHIHLELRRQAEARECWERDWLQLGLSPGESAIHVEHNIRDPEPARATLGVLFDRRDQ